MLTAIHQVWQLLDKSARARIPLAIVFAIALSCLETLGIGLIFPVLQMVENHNANLELGVLGSVLQQIGGDIEDSTALLAYMIVGLFLFKNLFGVLIVRWNNAYALGVKARTTRELFSLYMNAPYSWHVETSSPTVIRNFQALYTVFATIFIPCINVFTDFVLFFALLGLLLWADPAVAAIMTGLLGVGAIVYVFLNRIRTRSAAQHSIDYFGRIIRGIQESLGAVRDIRIHGRLSNVESLFSEHIRAATRAQYTQTMIQALPRYYLETLIIVGLSAAFGFKYLTTGSSNLFATLGVFLVAGVRLLPSVNRLVNAAQSILIGLPSLEIVYRDYEYLKSCKTKMVANSSSQRVVSNTPVLRLENVSYRYASRPVTVLKGINFEIFPGEMIGIVGASGAGKSTLLDIITGLLEPTSGVVMVDGVPLSEVTESWQKQIGFVPQSVFMMDDSVRSNIAFGFPEETIDDDRIDKVIEMVQLDDTLSQLPEGLLTSVGERGVRLSGGQRQRIGIARALYHDPQILVLDEATSSLDNETESKIKQFIMSVQGKKTLIMIAHRMSTIEDADRLIFLKDGAIAGIGSFQELCDSNQDFRAMTRTDINGNTKRSSLKEGLISADASVGDKRL